MIKHIHQAVREGKLTEAIQYCENILQDEPMNFEIRGQFTELLCLAGDLERADKQLDFMVQKKPDFAVGAVNLRHLIRAQQARVDFHNGNDVPQLFHEADEMDSTFLELHMALSQGDKTNAAEFAAKLESLRLEKQTDATQSHIRDLDDTLGGYLELLGTNGKYYLAQFSEIKHISIQKPESLLELVWLRVEIEVNNGESGTAYLPSVYHGAQTDVAKLAQVTDWDESNDDLITGSGMKMLFVNDDAITINELAINSEVEAV